MRRRPPLLGEHNDELLQELGFTVDEIDGFRAGGAIPHIWEGATLSGGGG